MTNDELDALKTVVRGLVQRGHELAAEIDQVVVTLAAARQETRETLAAIQNGCDIPESSSLYAKPLATDQRLFDQIVSESGRMRSLFQGYVAASDELKHWRNQNADAFSRIDATWIPTPDESYVLRRWMVAAREGPTVWTYYSSIPVFALAGLVKSYRDGHRAFLGREPGKQFDLRAGIEAVGDEVKDLILDVGTGGGAVLFRIGVATIRPPIVKDIASLRAAALGVERVFRLQRVLNDLCDHASFVQQIATSAEQVVADSFEAIKNDGAVVVDIVRKRLPS